MYHHSPYPTHVGYVDDGEQETGYPAYEPNRGPTRAHAPSFQMPPQVPPNPFVPAPGQYNPVISNSKKRNNRKKRQEQALLALPWVPQPMQSAAQGVVIHQVLRSAPPGQQWILVPTQPSGIEIPLMRYLEHNNTGGAPEAQPPQPRPEPLPVLQLQQPVLPPLTPKPQDLRIQNRDLGKTRVWRTEGHPSCR